MMLIAAAVFSLTTVSAPSFAKVPSTAGLQHSNKGGALRGLDRANSVAGTGPCEAGPKADNEPINRYWPRPHWRGSSLPALLTLGNANDGADA